MCSALRTAPRLTDGERRLGERGGRGDPGRVGSPRRAHAAGARRDPAAPAPWGVRFSRPGTFVVKSGFLLYWRSQSPKQA